MSTATLTELFTARDSTGLIIASTDKDAVLARAGDGVKLGSAWVWIPDPVDAPPRSALPLDPAPWVFGSRLFEVAGPPAKFLPTDGHEQDINRYIVEYDPIKWVPAPE